MWRRAYGLGLISVSTGVVADEHQVETGLWLDDCQNPADYLVRWIVTGCEWHETGGTSVVEPSDDVNADRAERYALECAGDVDSCGVELMKSDQTPVWFVEWCARLVHLPKLDYLYALGAAEWLNGPGAVDPGTAWSGKVGRQFAARCRK